MLIDCPECSGMVSERAYSCPHCGFPIQTMNLPQKEEKPVKTENTRHRKKFKKLPNGTGGVTHLSGNRRKPYAAYPPTKEFRENGSPVRKKAIGYFETYNEAYTALVNYNQNPIEPSKYTFATVYEKFIEEKFNDPNSQVKLSDSALKNYKWAYGKCEELYEKPMNQIYKDDMQKIMDSIIDKSYASSQALRSLFNGMFRYAIENGVVEKNYAEYVKIKRARDGEKGVPFTEEEIKVMWNHKNNTNVQIALILIYSGLRISELKKTAIDLEKKEFIGGLKTTAGKTRIVPIHDSILEFVKEFDQSCFSVGNYQERLFKKTLTTLGFPNAATGEKHTPHDCRHTFSWLADKYKMDDMSKHMIMGHSLGKDVEKNTYGHRTVEELHEEMAKIKVFY